MKLAQAFEQVGRLSKVAEGEFTSLDALMASNSVKGETTAASIGKLGNAITALADAMANPLLPHIKAVTDGLTEMAEAATKSSEEVENAVGKNLAKTLDWTMGKMNIPLPVPSMKPGGKTQWVGGGKVDAFSRFRNWMLGIDPNAKAQWYSSLLLRRCPSRRRGW